MLWWFRIFLPFQCFSSLSRACYAKLLNSVALITTEKSTRVLYKQALSKKSRPAIAQKMTHFIHNRTRSFPQLTPHGGMLFVQHTTRASFLFSLGNPSGWSQYDSINTAFTKTRQHSSCKTHSKENHALRDRVQTNVSTPTILS